MSITKRDLSNYAFSKSSGAALNYLTIFAQAFEIIVFLSQDLRELYDNIFIRGSHVTAEEKMVPRYHT